MVKLFKSLFGSNEETIKIGLVNKFISFENDKLMLINSINDITKPIKIISFLGNARIGKSTLMNCYLSHKLNQNIKLFNTSNKMDKHCTSGIDMLLVDTKEYNLLLLDVQGLDLNNQITNEIYE
jgi:putative ribosome biogenesis GTPase RsgA